MRILLAFVAVVATSPCWATAQDEAESNAAAPARLTREELRERQLDVAYEARDVERVLTKLKRASELAKTMIGEVAQTTETVSAALDRGDSAAAQSDARTAAEKFREIAKLLEALLAEESPPKIAAARDLATQLARLERELAKELDRESNPELNSGGAKGTGKPNDRKTVGGKNKPDPQETEEPKPEDKGQAPKPQGQGGEPKPKETGDEPQPDDPNQDGAGASDKTPSEEDQAGGGGASKGETETEDRESAVGGTGPTKPDEKSDEMSSGDRLEALAEQAEKLARDGRILEDILKVLAESTEPGDQEKAEKIDSLLKETKLLDAVEAMQGAADAVREGQLAQTRLSALDTADRMEVAARRLDALYRAVVAPQVEELRQLEQALAELREKLDELESESEIGDWHREARQLLDRAESAGVEDSLLDEWAKQLNAFRIGDARTAEMFRWNADEIRFVPPQEYGDKLRRVQQEIQEQIQTLLLNDLTSADDDNTPPKYQELVERYYRVLAGDKSNEPGSAGEGDSGPKRDQNPK